MKGKKNKKGKISLSPYIKVAFFSLLLCVSVGLCLFYGLFYSEYEKYTLIDIPALYGVKENDIGSIDGVVIYKSYDYSDDEFNGRVIYQSAHGKKKSDGEYALLLKIGLGRRKNVLPSLIGMSEDEAVRQIKSLFGYVTVKYVDAIDSSGRVIGQEPKKNSIIYDGDTVNIVVSKQNKSKSVQVPFLEGMEVRDAMRKIKESNLSLGKISYVFCEDVNAGTVLRQSLFEGCYVLEKRTIDITVAKSEIKPKKESRKNIWMTKEWVE